MQGAELLANRGSLDSLVRYTLQERWFARLDRPPLQLSHASHSKSLLRSPARRATPLERL